MNYTETLLGFRHNLTLDKVQESLNKLVSQSYRILFGNPKFVFKPWHKTEFYSKREYLTIRGQNRTYYNIFTNILSRPCFPNIFPFYKMSMQIPLTSTFCDFGFETGFQK